MSCIAAPKLSVADIPGLSLLLGNVDFTPPDVAGNFCCNFSVQIPGFPLVLPLGAIIAALSAVPGGGAIVDEILSTINDANDTLNELLDQLSFDCPLD